MIGKSENGTLVKRITSTAIEPQLPEKPIITMKTKAVGKIQTSAAIKCYVESVVPFNVSWYKDDKQLIENQNCRYKFFFMFRRQEYLIIRFKT